MRISLDEVSRDARIRRIETIAEWLDNRFSVPGTNWRIGLDGLIGLIPGVGDAAMALVSAYLVYEARRLGVSNVVIARMVLNVLIDFAVGSIPALGDLFDLVFKANARNVRLLIDELGRGRVTR